MNAIDVTKFPEVPLGPDGEPRRPDDPPTEIVRAASGLLYERRVVYWRHIPTLAIPSRASPLLVHALEREWWWTWAYEPGHVHHRETISRDRFVALANALGGTAGNDERIAWRFVNLYCRMVLPRLCDLAGLPKEAARLRQVPTLSARNAAQYRRAFRQVERAAETIVPWVSLAKRPPETRVDRRLDTAESRSGMLALWVAMIGSDVKGGEKREWDRVRRVYDTIGPMVDGPSHALYRVAGRVATIEQADAFEHEMTELIDDLVRDLPRTSPARRAA